jgi:hypothetical protein
MDVLAVKWLRANQPSGCKAMYGRFLDYLQENGSCFGYLKPIIRHGSKLENQR